MPAASHQHELLSLPRVPPDDDSSWFPPTPEEQLLTHVYPPEIGGERSDELNKADLDVIGDLTTWVRPMIRTSNR